MKFIKIILLIFLLTGIQGYSQKEFWGLTSTGGSADTNYGHIFKTDFTGSNAVIVHTFDNEHGMRPYGKLLLASNGKLYGTASEGGVVQPNPSNTGGVLFEYDPVLNQFNVVDYFGSGNLASLVNPKTGLIEKNGILYGTASGVGIFQHSLADQNTSVAALVTVPYTGSNSFSNLITGELMMASNGLIYGTTQYYSSCPTLTPLLGSIIRFNPADNSFSYIYPFNCTYFDGASPTGSLVEGAPGKLYGTTQHGGDYGYEPGIGDGVLFEYDIEANTYTKKFIFNHATTGAFPGPLTKGANNKFYGLLSDGGKDPNEPDVNNVVKGSVYEYDPETGALTVLYYFSDAAPNIYEFGYAPHGRTLQASDGIFYGINNGGIFRFNPVTSSVSVPPPSDVPYFYPNFSGDLIEVCRKPSYVYFEEDNYTLCAGSDFTFDVHNTNAASYVWKKDGTALPAQNTGILNLTNLTIADSGTYTCEMLNECGSTITMPLHLTVEICAGLDEVIGRKNMISLYPNPAKDNINVLLPDNPDFTVQDISIFNNLGQRVYNQANLLSVDVQNLSEGMYLLQLTTNKGCWYGKFIKH